MTYPEAIHYLSGLGQFSMRLGLERVEQLAASLGSPHRGLRFVHVAGTNGKGSTCAFLASIYQASGRKVGLFTSPHLIQFGERIQINGAPIPHREVVKYVEQLRPLLAALPADDHPTFFEVVTLMALLHFHAEACDLVIWETGLGGRLDATNIVTPLASVITRIGLDHQQWLGNTLSQIAKEKAGIIKPGVPCVSAFQHPDVEAVLRSTCDARQASFRMLDPDASQAPALRDVRISLAGRHQRQNAALALATVEILSAQLPVSSHARVEGLEYTVWPGRFQRIHAAGHLRILDGAHNTDGAQVLRDTFEGEYPNRKATFILGVLKDKSWECMLEILFPIMERLVLVPVDSQRTATPDELEPFCRSHAPQLQLTKAADLKEALLLTQDANVSVIAGSLYLIGQAMELLQPSSSPPNAERELNEWAPTAKSS